MNAVSDEEGPDSRVDGSIGTQALEVIAGPDDLGVAGLSAGSNWESLLEQAKRTARQPSRSPIPRRAERARRGTDRCSPARRGSATLIDDSEPDLVLNAIVGAAGLGPTIVALTEGIDLALANKESLVVGGELVMALAEATDAASSRWTPSTPRCTS